MSSSPPVVPKVLLSADYKRLTTRLTASTNSSRLSVAVSASSKAAPSSLLCRTTTRDNTTPARRTRQPARMPPCSCRRRSPPQGLSRQLSHPTPSASRTGAPFLVRARGRAPLPSPSAPLATPHIAPQPPRMYCQIYTPSASSGQHSLGDGITPSLMEAAGIRDRETGRGRRRRVGGRDMGVGASGRAERRAEGRRRRYVGGLGIVWTCFILLALLVERRVEGPGGEHLGNWTNLTLGWPTPMRVRERD